VIAGWQGGEGPLSVTPFVYPKEHFLHFPIFIEHRNNAVVEPYEIAEKRPINAALFLVKWRSVIEEVGAIAFPVLIRGK
jgi:hypothetical protein